MCQNLPNNFGCNFQSCRDLLCTYGVSAVYCMCTYLCKVYVHENLVFVLIGP